MEKLQYALQKHFIRTILKRYFQEKNTFKGENLNNNEIFVLGFGEGTTEYWSPSFGTKQPDN